MPEVVEDALALKAELEAVAVELEEGAGMTLELDDGLLVVDSEDDVKGDDDDDDKEAAALDDEEEEPG